MTQATLNGSVRKAPITNYPDLSECAVDDVENLPVLTESSFSSDWRGTYYNTTIGQQVAKPSLTSISDTKFPVPSSDNFVALLGDPTSYLETNGIREVTIPSTYASLDSYDPFITTVTAAGSGIGYGLNGHDLRGLLRLTNGKGHISSDTRVFHCEDDGGVRFLAIGPEGCYLLEQGTVQRWEAGGSITKPSRTPEEITPFIDVDDAPRINGDMIPEQKPELQQALLKFIEIFDKYASTTIEGYEKYDGSHWFVDTEGDQVRASGLSYLMQMETEPESVCGTTSYEVPDREYRGTTFDHEITAADIKYGIGEITDSVLGEDKHVIGYDTQWRESEYIFSGGLNKVILEIQHVYFQDQDRDTYSHHDFEIRTEDEEVAIFDPDDSPEKIDAQTDTNS
jgi:hypothetical protein